jgi:hypothetical protein
MFTNKKLIRTLFFTVASFIFLSANTSSNAATVEYTFSGEVSEIIVHHDHGGSPDEYGILSIGDGVSYTVLIDTGKSASRTQLDGDVIVEPFFREDYAYFFVDYVSGDLIQNETNTYSDTLSPYTYGNTVVKRNYGIVSGPIANSTTLSVGTMNSSLDFHMDPVYGSTATRVIDLLSLGMQFTTLNVVRDADGWMTVKSEVTLTTVTNAVPIPESITLLSIGIVGLFGVYRKYKDKI